jgi:hypothetical protein
MATYSGSFPFRITFRHEKKKETIPYRGLYYCGWSNGCATVRDPACVIYSQMEISYIYKRHIFTLTFIETDLQGRDR